MRRVVITGMGIVSPLGDSLVEVLESLRKGKSGITYQPAYEELQLRSRVGGFTKIDIKEHVDKKDLRFMGDAAAFAHIAMQQAIKNASLDEAQVSNPRTGLIMGSGGTSAANVISSSNTLRSRGFRRVSPFMVPRTMSSTVSAARSPLAPCSSACKIRRPRTGFNAELPQRSSP